MQGSLRQDKEAFDDPVPHLIPPARAFFHMATWLFGQALGGLLCNSCSRRNLTSNGNDFICLKCDLLICSQAARRKPISGISGSNSQEASK
jgi:hypothetical protein